MLSQCHRILLHVFKAVAECAVPVAHVGRTIALPLAKKPDYDL
jgi:hypothetical protein